MTSACGRAHSRIRNPKRARAPETRQGWLTLCADIVRLAVLCAAGAFLAADDGSAALKAALVLAPTVAARVLRVNPALDLLFALALGLEAIFGGTGGDSAGRDDTLPHIALPLLSGPVLYASLVRLGAVAQPSGPPTARSLLAYMALTAVSVMTLGAAWELVEWGADSALGTNYSQGYHDTRVDLLNDAIGAMAAGILVAIWLRTAAGNPRLQPVIHASERERQGPDQERLR